MTPSRRYCSFRLGDHLFGIPVEKVQEVLRSRGFTPVPLTTPEVAGLLNLRGEIVTVIDLHRRLRLGQLAEETPIVLVVRAKVGTVCLPIDAIGDVLHVADETFEAPPDSLEPAIRGLVRGVYKLEGELLLALDVEEITNLERILETSGGEG